QAPAWERIACEILALPGLPNQARPIAIRAMSQRTRRATRQLQYHRRCQGNRLDIDGRHDLRGWRCAPPHRPSPQATAATGTQAASPEAWVTASPVSVSADVLEAR